MRFDNGFIERAPQNVDDEYDCPSNVKTYLKVLREYWKLIIIMAISVVLIVLIVIVPFVSFTRSSQEPIKISIFYDSRCLDSIKFFTEQLAPNYNRLDKKIIIDFVPYGKVKSFLIDEFLNAWWQFKCQHGEEECYGNMMHACGLNETDDQATKVNFIICTMSESNPASDTVMKRCAIASRISWENMVMCFEKRVGEVLLANYGDRTNALEPKINFVPTIIYNDVYDNTLQKNSLENFPKTVLFQYIKRIYKWMFGFKT